MCSIRLSEISPTFHLNQFQCSSDCNDESLKERKQRPKHVFKTKPASPHVRAVQAGLLTPLTFARHRLSPLAAFTSGAYFLHNGRR